MKHTRTFDIRRIKGDPNVTEAEAAAIAAYTGPVQKIQMGKSAFEVNYIWEGRELIERVDTATSASWHGNTLQRRQAAQRREKIRAMIAEDKTLEQMAEALQINLGSVRYHIRRIETEAKQ